MHHTTCMDARVVMHVGIANLWWWGKRSWHFRRMRNPQFYVSGKRPIEPLVRLDVLHMYIYLLGKMIPHYNDKTKLKSPYDGSSYTGKAACLYWGGPGWCMYASVNCATFGVTTSRLIPIYNIPMKTYRQLGLLGTNFGRIWHRSQTFLSRKRICNHKNAILFSIGWLMWF